MIETRFDLNKNLNIYILNQSWYLLCSTNTSLYIARKPPTNHLLSKIMMLSNVFIQYKFFFYSILIRYYKANCKQINRYLWTNKIYVYIVRKYTHQKWTTKKRNMEIQRVTPNLHLFILPRSDSRSILRYIWCVRYK